MPYLTVKTNKELNAATADAFLKEISKAVAEALSKPEQYMMVSFEPRSQMLFGADNCPQAFVEVRAINLPDDAGSMLSPIISDLLERHLGIPADRVYTNYISLPPTNWGMGEKTFG